MEQHVSPGTLEAGTSTKSTGHLHIRFYQPRPDTERNNYEPVQSHLKLTAVEGRVVVLGSGNLDRASWFTSQELGVAFISAKMVAATMATLQVAMTGRSKLFYDSASG